MEVEGQQVEMPTPDKELKLKHHFKKLRSEGELSGNTQLFDVKLCTNE